ncbi:MAG TPA: hypothetical protein VLC98_05775 [Phnomibacter sp.]|nr:hypothetical protein [Phnomibacter sp.]
MKILDPCWLAWKSIIDRCYNPYTVNVEPGYINVYVCDEWFNSCMAFREWWIKNYVEDYKIDKDILTDNQIYSPETCLYLPEWLNRFATGSRNTKSNLPRGIHLSEAKNPECKYVGEVLHPITKETYWRASFPTPELAHRIWVAKKLLLAKELKSEMDDIDIRIYPRVVELIQRP